MLITVPRTSDDWEAGTRTRYGKTIKRLLKSARQFPWDGRTPPHSDHRVIIDPFQERERVFSILCTYDVGAHDCGWLRNSQYDSCWHLSFCALQPAMVGGAQYAELRLEEVQGMARAFFGSETRKAWLEPPARAGDTYRDAPSSRFVWHVRLFTDKAGNVIQPEGEVYELVPFADGSSPEKVFR